MKPLGALCGFVSLYDYLQGNDSIILNGFKAAGIVDFLSMHHSLYNEKCCTSVPLKCRLITNYLSVHKNITANLGLCGRK